MGYLSDRANGACLPGLIHRALVWVLQEHLPNDTGVHEVHKVDQGSGYLKRRLQVGQGLPGFGWRLPLDSSAHPLHLRDRSARMGILHGIVQPMNDMITASVEMVPQE